MACGVDFKRDALLDTTQETKAKRVGVANLVQRPVLVIRFKRQPLERLHMRGSIGMTNRLIHPRAPKRHIVKRGGREFATFLTRYGEDAIRGLGIDG